MFSPDCRETGFDGNGWSSNAARTFRLRFSKRPKAWAILRHSIEKAGEVEVSSSAVVAAVQAYAKINAQGQWIDRSEHIDVNALFERMSNDELDAYARDGVLPDWFRQTVGATQGDNQDAGNDE